MKPLFVQITLIYVEPSPKDDVISLLYMLLYLRDGSLPWTKNFRLMTVEQNFERTLNFKKYFHRELKHLPDSEICKVCFSKI